MQEVVARAHHGAKAQLGTAKRGSPQEKRQTFPQQLSSQITIIALALIQIRDHLTNDAGRDFNSAGAPCGLKRLQAENYIFPCFGFQKDLSTSFLPYPVLGCPRWEAPHQE